MDDEDNDNCLLQSVKNLLSEITGGKITITNESINNHVDSFLDEIDPSDDDDDDDDGGDRTVAAAGGLLLILCTIRCEYASVEKLCNTASIHNHDKNIPIFFNKYREYQFISAYDIAFCGRNKSYRYKHIFDLFQGQLCGMGNKNSVYKPPSHNLLKIIPDVLKRYNTGNSNNNNDRLLLQQNPPATGGFYRSTPPSYLR
ncbi:MAG: hypothetical protein ACI90V_004968 [Bacillariaceae sp.]|jgi:hypothetical protein